MNQDGRGDLVSPSVNTTGDGGDDRVVIMRLCSCTTGMAYRSELVPFPASYEDATLDAIMVFSTSLPSNTTPSDIEIKYAFKCADGSGSWAGLSSTRGSPEKWRKALKASNPCELGVFDVSLMNPENTCREFPYSSQTTQNATSATQVSVKFNTHQAVFDAPPTLAACISSVSRAFSGPLAEAHTLRRHRNYQSGIYGNAKPEAKLYAHSAHGRSAEELDEVEYQKLRLENSAVILLEATYYLGNW